METEELTELLDDDLEMWAQGGTRILPKSQLERPTQQSYPPVAYATAPSVPPPPVASSSHAPIWAAAIGMAAVFFFASVGGGIFYAMHRASTTATASTSTTETTTVTTIATTEPEHVTLSTTSAPVVVVTPAPTVTATATQKTAAIAPPAVVRYGTIQTFAAGNGKPVFVDGKQVGVGGSHMKAVCGKHSVVVGTGKARTYDIPCRGAPLTVGPPD
jgi:hypothetical protein